MKRHILWISLCLTLFALTPFAKALETDNMPEIVYEDPPVFADAQTIRYKEAVDVISALKLVNGYENGNFRPGDILLRGAGCKIIARMCFTTGYDGSETIDDIDQYRDYGSGFEDVEDGSIFIRYINYCVDRGLISGYDEADGIKRFHPSDPSDPLTVGALLKILCSAIGYDAEYDGYGEINDDWRDTVRRLAINSRLFDGMEKEPDLDAAVTREEAALLVFNTLQADLMTHTTKITNVLTRLTETVATQRSTTSSDRRYRNVNDNTKSDGSQIIQFAEEYFGGSRQISPKYLDGLRCAQGNGERRWYWSYLDEKNELHSVGGDDGIGTYPIPPRSYRVTFNSNGGLTLPIRQQDRLVYESKPYGSITSLPTPEYPDMPQGFERAFEGWYLSPSRADTNRITDDTIVSPGSDRILYAHWSILDSTAEYTVTFNANGGENMNFSSKNITFQAMYGSLPSVTRQGYRFDGWYTSPDGGAEITNQTPAALGADHTLYAHWSFAHTVKFEINPPDQFELEQQKNIAIGKLNWNSKQVYSGPDEVYGSLPVVIAKPGSDDHIFMGWFTDPTDGVQVTPFTTVNLSGQSEQTLYAHWLSRLYSSLLTLYAHGGTISANGLSTYTINMQPDVPVNLSDYTPVRNGYRFLGWFTKPVGGETLQSFETDLSGQTNGQTILYAQWEWDGEQEADIFSRLTYSFSNAEITTISSEAMSVDHFQYIFGPGGKEARANILYNYHTDEFNSSRDVDRWGGFCYGISTTAAMFYTSGNGIRPEDFKINGEEKHLLSELDFENSINTDEALRTRVENGGEVRPFVKNGDGLRLREFIELMHISQYHIDFTKNSWENRDDLNKLCGEIQHPVPGSDSVLELICIYGRGLIPFIDEHTKEEKTRVTSTGHALLAYHLEEISSEESWLFVYDSNYPLDNGCYIVMNKDEEGFYNGWCYIGESGECYSDGLDGSWISYIPYETYFNIWMNRGTPDTNSKPKDVAAAEANAEIKTDVEMSVLFSSASDATITGTSGRLVARFRNGLMTEWDDKLEIYPISPLTGEAAASGFAIWLPADGVYTIVNEDDQDFYTMSIANLTDGLKVEHTASRSAVLSAQDHTRLILEIEHPGTDYKLSVITDAQMEYGQEMVPDYSGVQTDDSLSLHFDGESLTILGGAQNRISINDTDYNGNAQFNAVN